MAKYRTSGRRSARPLLPAVAACGLTAVLAFGSTTGATALAKTVAPDNLVIGVGGAMDPAGDRVPAKFDGSVVGAYQAAGYRYVGLPYPALLPVDPSVDAGVPTLHAAIADADGRVAVIGYSEGSLVAERVKRDLEADPDRPDPDELEFVFIASPLAPGGGIYSRFPGLALPGFTSTGAAQPSQYNSTYYSMEYDLVADFPAYANPLSLANGVVGFLYLHGDRGADNVDLTTHPQSVVRLTNTKGGTDTYVLIRAERLPLLQPLRDVSAATGLSGLTEPVLGAVEPTLRNLVDMGYSDRHRPADGGDSIDDGATEKDDDNTAEDDDATEKDATEERVDDENHRDGAKNSVDRGDRAAASNDDPVRSSDGVAA